jgi:hypothetical protein
MPTINLIRNHNGSIDCQFNDDALDLDNEDLVALMQDAIAILQAELLTAELQA